MGMGCGGHAPVNLPAVLIALKHQQSSDRRCGQMLVKGALHTSPALLCSIQCADGSPCLGQDMS